MDVLLTLPDVTAMWTFWSEFILKKKSPFEVYFKQNLLIVKTVF